MKFKKFEEFAYIVLVNASQVAYLEEARVTHTLLSKFNELYRYMIKDEEAVVLSEEIAALRNYVDIQTIRYGNRFEITFAENGFDGDAYISHLTAVDFLDHTLNASLTRCEGFFIMKIRIKTGGSTSMQITVESDGAKENFVKTLIGRGENVCIG